MDSLAEVTMLERENREKLRLHNIILGKINLQFTLAYPAIAVNGILGLSKTHEKICYAILYDFITDLASKFLC